MAKLRIIGLLLFTLSFTTLNGYSQNKKKVESSTSIYTGERNRETDKVLIKSGDQYQCWIMSVSNDSSTEYFWNMDVYIKSHATHEINKGEKLYFQLGNGEIEIIYSVNNATSSSANLYWDILHTTYTIDKNLLKKIENYGLKGFRWENRNYNREVEVKSSKSKDVIEIIKSIL